VISIVTRQSRWATSACQDSVAIRLADGPSRLRQDKSAQSPKPAFFARALYGATAAHVAPAVSAGVEVPTQQITKGGLRGPHSWRDDPVIT
jgi:hypothetical protein